MSTPKRRALLNVSLLGALLCVSSQLTAGVQCLPTAPMGFPKVDTAYQSGFAGSTAKAQQARETLGEILFRDTRLSRTGQHSCASCHAPAQAFTDGLPRSRGAAGDTLAHNAPTLFNTGLKFQFNWRSGGPQRLAQHHLGPLTNTAPLELGFGVTQLARLNRDRALLQTLDHAQIELEGEPVDEFSVDAIAALLAAYVSTLNCATVFDQYLFEGQESISPLARQGLTLFTSAELGCNGCHRGPLLGGGLRTSAHAFPAITTTRTRGTRRIQLVTPSLRQVSRTAPYLFDGSAATLSDVLAQYAAGTPLGLPGFPMSQEREAALLAFLETL